MKLDKVVLHIPSQVLSNSNEKQKSFICNTFNGWSVR